MRPRPAALAPQRRSRPRRRRARPHRAIRLLLGLTQPPQPEAALFEITLEAVDLSHRSMAAFVQEVQARERAPGSIVHQSLFTLNPQALGAATFPPGSRFHTRLQTHFANAGAAPVTSAWHTGMHCPRDNDLPPARVRAGRRGPAAAHQTVHQCNRLERDEGRAQYSLKRAGRACKVNAPAATMPAMMENLLTWSAPYGGATLLLLIVLAIASYGLLLHYKARLTESQLRRSIRLAALVALPLSFIAMEMGSHNWGIAVLSFVWCIVVGITCKNEITRRIASTR